MEPTHAKSSEAAKPATVNPLVLADGTKIDPVTGQVLRDRINYFEGAHDTQTSFKFTPRGLDEIGVKPEMLKAAAIVVALTIMGLSDVDISNTLGTTKERIQAIRELGAYGKCMDAVVQGVAETYANDARMLFAAKSRSAAQRMFELADSDDEKVAQKAAADVLDRAGMRPVDTQRHQIMLDGTLRIEYIKNDEKAVVPVTLEHEDGDGS